MINPLSILLQKHQRQFAPIIEINTATDKIIPLNFTATNTDINPTLIADTATFSTWVNHTLQAQNATYGIGGYNENRVLYNRSNLFDGAQNRTLHLGVDIWGAVGTPVFAPLGGMVHSFAFNDNFGDYGATIILQHNIETTAFYTLYGHLSLADLATLRKGMFITRGEEFAHFGNPTENGNWPPHLHFQVIEEIDNYEGDFPGVCALEEAEKYVYNCPDANLLLNF